MALGNQVGSSSLTWHPRIAASHCSRQPPRAMRGNQAGASPPVRKQNSRRPVQAPARRTCKLAWQCSQIRRRLRPPRANGDGRPRHLTADEAAPGAQPGPDAGPERLAKPPEGVKSHGDATAVNGSAARPLSEADTPFPLGLWPLTKAAVQLATLHVCSSYCMCAPATACIHLCSAQRLIKIVTGRHQATSNTAIGALRCRSLRCRYRGTGKVWQT